MRKNRVVPTHKPNEKRQKAKAKRDKGQLAMSKAGMSQLEWTQKHDPLFMVRGAKRHEQLQRT